MFLTRANYWALGGLDSGYFLHVEDLDLAARFARAGGEICLVPSLRLHHGRSSSAASPLFIEWHKTRGFRRYFRKEGLALPQQLLLEAALFARLGLLVTKALLLPGRRGRRHGSG